MNKIFLAAIFLLGSTCASISQSTFTSVTLNTVLQPGLIIHLPNNEEVAEGTILQKLKETGYTPETSGSLFWKKSKTDGYYVFSGVQLAALNNQKLDMYFKVDRESKSRKDQSVIYLLVSKGYNNFISPENDSASFAAATSFLNGFAATTASYRLQLDIAEQTSIVKKSEKKLADMQDDEKGISRKITDLQTALRSKQNDQVLQQQEIAGQQVKLDQLKLKIIQ